MTALLFDGRQARVVEIEPRDVRSTRAPGEARLRLRLAGVCRTDVEIAKGYMGFSGVLGHEFVADVIESDDPALAGKRVVGRINCGCGRCARCAQGRESHCETRTVLGILGRDGCFQGEFLLPEKNLVALPDSISDDEAVFVEPLAAACRILEQIEVAPWQRVAILGDGKLGLLVALALADAAASVTLIGRHPGRVPLPANVVERSQAAVAGRRFDVVVDATGRAEGLAICLDLAEPEGRVVLKTTCAGEQSIALAPVVIDELTIVGSRCGPFEKAIARMQRARLPVDALIAARYPLSAAADALAKAAEPGVLKVLIEGAPRP